MPRALKLLQAQCLPNRCQVMPAVPHCMVFNNELSCHGRTETQRERRRVVEFSIREGSYRSGRLAAVLPQEFERSRLRHLSVVFGMFGIQLCDVLPRDVRNGPATGDCSREVNLDWIHTGNMVNDNTNGALVRGRHECVPFSV